jgi:hypothetical protein
MNNLTHSRKGFAIMKLSSHSSRAVVVAPQNTALNLRLALAAATAALASLVASPLAMMGAHAASAGSRPYPSPSAVTAGANPAAPATDRAQTVLARGKRKRVGRAHSYRTPAFYRRARRSVCPPSCPPKNAYLTYGGGSVVHNLTAYLIFWLPSGYHYEAAKGAPASAGANDLNYEALIKRFFNDVGGTPYYNIMTQYSDQVGHVDNTVTLGGSWVNYNKLNYFNKSDLGTVAHPLQDVDIQDEISLVAKARSWPLGNPDVEYFVFTPGGVESCGALSCSGGIDPTNGYCAYHSSFGTASGTVLYANMYDAGYSTACGGPNWTYNGMFEGTIDGSGPNGDAYADYELTVTSHEMDETVTDPLGGSGWYDSVNNNEIGDTCAWVFGKLSSGGDVVLNGHSYLLQEEWSNATKSCSLSYNRAATLAVNSKADGVTGYGITPLCPNAPGGDVNNKSYILRCAIEDANNDALAGTIDHTITFDKCGATCDIAVGSPLPTLSAQGLNIYGGGRATLSGGGSVDHGLLVGADNISIYGLTVEKFKYDAIDVVKATEVQIGGLAAGNTLRNNGGFGVRVGQSTSDASTAILVSNRIYGNDKGGIVLTGQAAASCSAGFTFGDPNDYTPCPSITSAKPGLVKGTTACTSVCWVQLFLVPSSPDSSGHGQAQEYIGQVKASSGSWSIAPTMSLVKGDRVTAIVNDMETLTASEFSANKIVA